MTNIDTETLKNIKVLYVEDELDIQQTTLEILESIFDVVIPASNGVEAFDLYTDHGDFDILVTDINMPKMDGIELIKKIRSIDNNLPITITTAHTEVDFLHESINLGVNGYTLKPVNLIKLIETISKAVESRVLRKELERLNTNLIQKLKEKTFELNSILDSQENLVAVSDGVNVHTINQKFLDFLGKKSLADLEDSNISSICDLFIKEDGYYFHESADDKCCLPDIEMAHNSDVYVKMKNLHGRDCIFKINITTYEFNGTHYVLTLTNITTLKEQSDLLKYKANHDHLTGLFNRQYFNELLTSEINRAVRYDHTFSLVMFDIDFFKNINDTYGHDIGDEVLRNISKIVKHHLRETDTLSRWGGEEFMILLSETDLGSSMGKIESLREKIQNSALSDIIKDNITASFGITEFKFDDTKDVLLKRVDIALYDAKNSGRNKVIQA
jgi:diguanylate cyclase (GGDEF)-like protein